MNSNPTGAVAAPTEPAVPLEATVVPPAMEQVPSAELADLRRRADRYRFLYRTIVTVTGIIVGATLVILLAAILTDM